MMWENVGQFMYTLKAKMGTFVSEYIRHIRYMRYLHILGILGL